MSLAWIYLLLAGCFEISWAIGLKFSDGFTKLWPSLFTLITGAASFYFLAKAVTTLPIGTAYAVWVGIGAMGTAVLGILLFQETFTTSKLFFLSLLMISIIGLKISH